MKFVRLLNLAVVAVLVLAAAYVYKIKFESTQQAQYVAKLRQDIRAERDAVVALRAEWSQLDSPGRIQGIVERHFPLKPVDVTQLDGFDHLPERPPETVTSDVADPIGAMIESLHNDLPTGSVKGRAQ